MLFGDQSKYMMLVSGMAFATLLMAQQSALFCGIMRWTYSPLVNMNVDIWVADPKVEQANENKPLRDTDADRVRSVNGVAWAAPLHQSIVVARDPTTSNFKFISLEGLDPTTLAGAPARMLQGSVEALRRPGTVIIDEFAVSRFSEGRDTPIGVGDRLEINDNEAEIVGVADVQRPFIGGPYVYTTYDRAVSGYAYRSRKMLSFVLADPAPGLSAVEVARRIERETGLKAFTRDEFKRSTIRWYFKNTGIPAVMGVTVIIGLVVGMAVSAQTFYSFVLENTRFLGALKAMGTPTKTLCGMLLFQSISVGLIGYGIGIGITVAFGRMAIKSAVIPYALPWQVPALVLGIVLIISSVAALTGIMRIAKLEPAIVFRT
jgi:putative ABC transport system permease protein